MNLKWSEKFEYQLGFNNHDIINRLYRSFHAGLGRCKTVSLAGRPDTSISILLEHAQRTRKCHRRRDRHIPVIKKSSGGLFSSRLSMLVSSVLAWFRAKNHAYLTAHRNSEPFPMILEKVEQFTFFFMPKIAVSASKTMNQLHQCIQWDLGSTVV